MAEKKNDAENNDGIILSIIIPTFNYGHLLSRVIESILFQRLPEGISTSTEKIEIIVVDDGSTDNTPEIVDLLEKKKFSSAFLPLIYLRQENAGAGSARNTGLRYSQGKFIFFVDADDELLPEALTSIIIAVKGNPSATVFLGGNITIQENGKNKQNLPPAKLPSSTCKRLNDYLIRKKIRVNHGSIVVSRDLMLQRPYVETFETREDIPVFAYLICNGTIETVQKPWITVYKHSDSLRHNFTSSEKKGGMLIDEVFYSLPESCQYLKRRYAAQRYASIFRSEILTGSKKTARSYFIRALTLDFRQALRWTNIRRLIGSYFK